MARILDPKDPYYIDNPGRVKSIQAEMQKRNIDVYLGSRVRTMSFILDAFCPWRSYIIIPAEGLPSLFTFVIDAVRIGDETWQINTIRDILKARSRYDYETFTFTAKKNGTVFEGKVSARLEDYAGVTYEDTDGSPLYCHNSKI